MISITAQLINEHPEETKWDCFQQGEKICMIEYSDLCDLLSDREYKKFQRKSSSMLFVDEVGLFNRARTIYSSL